jgi:hypothetical protein
MVEETKASLIIGMESLHCRTKVNELVERMRIVVIVVQLEVSRCRLVSNWLPFIVDAINANKAM